MAAINLKAVQLLWSIPIAVKTLQPLYLTSQTKVYQASERVSLLATGIESYREVVVRKQKKEHLY